MNIELGLQRLNAVAWGLAAFIAAAVTAGVIADHGEWAKVWSMLWVIAGIWCGWTLCKWIISGFFGK